MRKVKVGGYAQQSMTLKKETFLRTGGTRTGVYNTDKRDERTDERRWLRITISYGGYFIV